MAIRAHRSQLIWSPVVGWVLLTCVGSVAHAQMESASPAAEILFEQTPAVDIPADVPVSSAAPGIGTSEVGIAVGAFTLYPSIEVQAGYDSNVYATAAPTVGSPYTLIKPVVELKSDWLNHSLRVAVSASTRMQPPRTTGTAMFRRTGASTSRRISMLPA